MAAITDRNFNTRKQLAFVILPLLVSLYFPMFGKLAPFIVKLFPYNFAKYSCILLSIAIVFTFIRNKNWKPIPSLITYLLFFNIYLVANLTSKGLLESNFQTSINLAVGIMLSSLVIILITQQKEFKQDKTYFDAITKAIGIVLIFQVIISALESISGNTFGTYEVHIIHKLEGRDIFELFNLSQRNLFGFSFPFTGLIGQHNRFGIMLIFYNMLFMHQYEYSKKPIYILFMFIVALALVGNSTRSAQFCVLITDILFLISNIRQKNKANQILISGIVCLFISAIMFYSHDIYVSLVAFYSRLNSLETRVLLWKYILNDYLFPESIIKFFFGITIKEFSDISILPFSGRVSIENEYLKIYLYFGITGLVLFAILLMLINNAIPKTKSRSKISNKLLIFNILFIGLFMEGLFHYASYILVTIQILSFIHNKIVYD